MLSKFSHTPYFFLNQPLTLHNKNCTTNSDSRNVLSRLGGSTLCARKTSSAQLVSRFQKKDCEASDKWGQKHIKQRTGVRLVFDPGQWRLSRWATRSCRDSGACPSGAAKLAHGLYNNRHFVPYAFDIAITTACTSTRLWLRGHGERTSRRRQWDSPPQVPIYRDALMDGWSAGQLSCEANPLS